MKTFKNSTDAFCAAVEDSQLVAVYICKNSYAVLYSQDEEMIKELAIRSGAVSGFQPTTDSRVFSQSLTGEALENFLQEL